MTFRLMRILKNTSTERKSKTYFGKVILIHPKDDLKIGQRVLTKEGIGTVFGVDESIDGDRVYIVGVRQGSMYLRVTSNELANYAVYHSPTRSYLFLSFQDYDYVLTQDQDIVYRVTKRNYAKLVPEIRHNYEWAKVINTTKGGFAVYKKLKKEGYELKRNNIIKPTTISQR